jgi:hypothetical protein
MLHGGFIPKGEQDELKSADEDILMWSAKSARIVEAVVSSAAQNYGPRDCCRGVQARFWKFRSTALVERPHDGKTC